MIYNDPVGGSASTVGPQIRTDYFNKKALIEAQKEQYFSQLADVTGMPKNMGKKIKRFHYLPILDDANINDQGLDAAGAVIDNTEYAVRIPNLVNTPYIVEAAEASFAAAHSNGDYIFITDSAQWLLLTGDTAIGYDASTAGGASGTELADSAIKALIEADATSVTATVSGASITVDLQDLVFAAEADATVAVQIIAGAQKTQRSGNLYGSSKDVGTISGKLPALSETGGRVNRVGMKRIELEGTIEKFGFFDEYTQESMDFDSDAELEMHITRESVLAANEITEDALQIDLLEGAGVIRFTGAATAVGELQGNDDAAPFDVGNTNDLVTYEDLMKLSIELDQNRTPKHTKMITGSRLIDTKTVSGARYMYIGSELIPAIERMKDLHGNQAFIPVQKYGNAGNIARGEYGSCGPFRFIVVPEMMKWAGAGAAVTAANTVFQETNGRYDVFPMMVIGSESFTTIGFQTDGKTVKFKITHKKPGKEIADRNDPYGETGFYSIKWYYGTMLLRTERLAVIKTIAEL